MLIYTHKTTAMKATTFIIIGFFFFQISYSQNKSVVVQYEAIKGTITNTETLLASNSKAVYLIDSLLVENDENSTIIKENLDRTEITINQKKIKLDATKFFLKKDDGVIFFTSNHQGNKVLVRDSLPNYSWDISGNETKRIGDFLCKKASTIFRGSQIIAWYAEELNVPFGPWKFKGLPGLILELYNTNDINRHSWRAQKIQFVDNKNILIDKNKNLPLVSYERIIIDTENEIKDQMNRMQARVPQGVSVSKSKLNRTSIERKFEWEK
jgi:GLPGLI family protein